MGRQGARAVQRVWVTAFTLFLLLTVPSAPAKAVDPAPPAPAWGIHPKTSEISEVGLQPAPASQTQAYLPIIVRSPPALVEIALIASADAYISESRPNANAGSDFFLLAGNDQEAPASAGVVRSLLRFDLPASSVLPVVSATLRVFYAGYWDLDGGTRVISLSAATEPWEEANVTWANQPGIGAAYGSVSINTDDPLGYREIDVTALVQAWVEGTTPDNGVYLTGPELGGSDAAYRAFLSRETATTNQPYPPKLVIKYQAGR